MKFKNYWLALAAGAFILGMAACSDSDDPDPGPGPVDPTEESAFVIVASSGTADYLIPSETLASGETTIVGTGKEVETGSFYLYPNNQYLYRLVYAQGNAGLCTAYYLDSNGKMQQRDGTYEISSRFTTYGPYDKYLILAASGATTIEGTTDPETGVANKKYGVTFSIIDMETEKATFKTVVTENLTGTGEYYTVSGVVERGGKIFTALCPQGLSGHGIAEGWAANDYKGRNNEDLVTTNATTNLKTLSPTTNPDSVWIAIYNGVDSNLDNPKIISDDRLQYATSRMQSQFYNMMAQDDNGNIYVFSSSNSVSASDDRQVTSKPSGVLRIKAGAEEFDKDYYYNIQSMADGCRIFQVFHITQDYFLLRMFDTASATSSSSSKVTTRRLAIFKAGEGKFTWVTGMPAVDNIGSFGTFPCFDDGKAYVPTVTLDGAQPAIYVIDPVTAVATKGISVTSQSVKAVGKLIKQQ